MKNLVEVEEVLVVVDMIRGFVNEGNMKDPYIGHIIPGIASLVEESIKKEKCEVFYIKDAHSKDAIEFKKFPVHCLDNTSESQMVEELIPYQDKVRVYKKNSTSALFAKGLLEDLKSIRNLKRVKIVGCCSDICVINFALPLINYFDENNLDVEVEVREDLIETYDSSNHPRDEYNQMALKLLKQAGAKLTKSEVRKNGR